MTARSTRAAIWVFALFAAYSAINIAIRLLLPPSLELDEAEQVFYSQLLALGYGPQPPLYNWLQAAVFALTGRTVFGLSLLKNALIFAGFLFYWLAASVVLKSTKLRLVAVLALLTLPQASFMVQQDLTHTVALIAATALFLYAFYRIVAAPDTSAYVLAGIAIAFGFLSKYNFPLLPVAALLAVLPERDLRDRIFNWRLLLAIAIAFLAVLPHLVWLMDNLELATSQTLSRMTGGEEKSGLPVISGLASLVVAIVAFSALTLVVFVAIYRRSTLTVLRSQSREIRITERMVVLLVIALALIIIGTGATHVRERWLDPFLLVLPLYLCMKIEAAGAGAAVTRKGLLAIPLAIMILVPASIYSRVATSTVSGKYTKVNIPFDTFAAQIIADEGRTPAAIVTADRHMAGNLLRSIDAPTITTQFPDFALPFAWSKERPLLLAWRTETGAEMPEALRQWLAANAANAADFEVRSATLPYHFARANDAYGFSYAWIYPVQP